MGIWLDLAIAGAALALVLLLYFLSRPVYRELDEYEQTIRRGADDDPA